MTFKIAIDGHAASGKGTIAVGVAKHFDLSYLDTGLIYRAVAKVALLKGQDFSNKALVGIARSFNSEYLNLEGLRSDTVGAYASKIASLPDVRLELIKFQQNFVSESQGAVLDGRDIGTVIMPEADIKVFVTADINIRANRRYKELRERDSLITLNTVLEDLLKRDALDSNRKHAPLKLTYDAHLIDTSELSIETAITTIIDLVESFKKNMKKV